MPHQTSGARPGTLHFINRIDETNAGDRVASPLTHYPDFFTRFALRRHDIRYIDWKAIGANDVVILGGGGLFDYAESINRAIRRLPQTGAAVIAWSPGFNTHHEYGAPFHTAIQFSDFDLLTVRDFGNRHGLDYLPDVTCKLPQLSQTYEITREFGIARHKDYEIAGLPFETITNRNTVDEILQFIGECEVVISNSYHMIYWATLMGKKCLSPGGFSTKFAHFQYPPEFFVPGVEDLSAVAERARSHDCLGEAIAQTDHFFAKVQSFVTGRLDPISAHQNIQAMATDSALHYGRSRETQLLPGDMVASKVVIDAGDGLDAEQRIVAINNVYGDDLLHVRFDLSGYKDLQQIRFHPIEGWYCNVEVVSAVSDSVPLVLIPQGSVKTGNFDKFLSPDPNYLSASPVGDVVEISFRLQRTAQSEHHPDPIVDWEGLLELREWERDRFEQEFRTTYQHLMGSTALLEDAQRRYEATATRLNDVEQSLSWRITAPLRRLRRTGRRQV